MRPQKEVPANCCESIERSPPGSAARITIRTREDKVMLYYAVVFLIVAIIAGFFGFSGIAGTSAWIAHVLFVLFLVLFIISLIFRGRPSV